MKFLIGIFLCGALCASAYTQTPKTPKPSKTETELMQIERDIGDANVRRDKAYFARIEAEECIFTDSGGGLTTRAEDLASLDQPAGPAKLISYVVDEMKVMDYGSTAVVLGRVTTTLRVNNNGTEREVVNRSRFTDVFVKRKGRWQIVAGHSSRIRDSQPAQ